jgi:hypothetical protein
LFSFNEPNGNLLWIVHESFRNLLNELIHSPSELILCFGLPKGHVCLSMPCDPTFAMFPTAAVSIFNSRFDAFSADQARAVAWFL